MRFKYKTLCIAIAAMGFNAAHAAHAGDTGENMFSLSGYGTLGFVHSSEKNADFANDMTVRSGSGRTDNWSATQLSRIGVQVDGKFSEQLSGTVQAVSEFNYQSSYAPSIAAAYIKYQVTPALALRAGRLLMPLFMLTEFSRVGYAVPWVTPPSETYGAHMTHDGADATYKFSLGDTALTAQGYYGKYEFKIGTNALPDPLPIKLNPTWGINLLADYGASTFRATHIESKFSMNNPTVNAAFNVYRAAGMTTLADQYQGNGQIGTFNALGYSYDPGNWFLRSEITRASWDVENTSALNYTSSYITAGYRVGKFTPYATYGRKKYDGQTSISASDPIGIINGMLAGNDESRHSFTVGTRWDFRDNMDLKLQFTRVTRDSNTSNGGLINQVPGSTLAPSYNLIMTSFDFVF